MSAGELEALQEALRVAHGAIYASGVIAAQSSGERRRVSLSGLDVHRARRDRLRDLVTQAGAAPAESAIAYRLPESIRSPEAAARLGASTEQVVALALGAVVEAAAGPVKAWAAGALQDAAVRETGWRGSPPQLPGMPVTSGVPARDAVAVTAGPSAPAG